MTDATREDLGLPWHGIYACGDEEVRDATGEKVADFWNEAQRDHAVTAANAHHELVEALANTICYGCEQRIGATVPRSHVCVSCNHKRQLLASLPALSRAEGGA